MKLARARRRKRPLSRQAERANEAVGAQLGPGMGLTVTPRFVGASAAVAGSATARARSRPQQQERFAALNDEIENTLARCRVYRASMGKRSEMENVTEIKTHTTQTELQWHRLQEGKYSFFKYRLSESRCVLRIELQTRKGDPDLYVSRKFRNPTVGQHTWASAEEGAVSAVLILCLLLVLLLLSPPEQPLHSAPVLTLPTRAFPMT